MPSLGALNPRGWAPGRRDDCVGAIILFVLINLTLLPFVWGHSSLEDSQTIPSLFDSGSRYPQTVDMPVTRGLDPGAPAWQTEPEFPLERYQLAVEKALPLWNPYSAYGSPLAADMQSQPYSPLAWIAIGWPSARGYDVFILMRLFVAGLFSFLYLRQFVGLWPALAGGTSFMYAGYLWLYITMPEVSTEVILPAVFFGVERILRRPGPVSTIVLALAISACIFGGMPESAMLVLVVAGLYGVIRLIADAELRRSFLPILGFGAGAAAAGVGLAAIAVVPFLEYIPLSYNAHTNAVPPTGYLFDGFAPYMLAQYIGPLLHGAPYNDLFRSFQGYSGIRGFFGATATFLALIAIGTQVDLALRKRRSKWPIFFFAGLLTFCLLKRWGVSGINDIGLLPGLRLVNFPKYEENLTAFAVAVLAGFGVAAVMERRAKAVVIWCAAAVPLACFAYVATSERQALASVSIHPEFYSNALAAALAAIALVATVCAAAVASRVPPRVLGAAAVGLLFLEPNVTFIVPLYYWQNQRPHQNASALFGARYLSFLKSNLRLGYRFLGEDSVLYPQWSAAFQIPDPRALDALYDSRYLPFLRQFLNPSADEELDTRFVGTDDVDFANGRQLRLLELSSVEFLGTNHPLGGILNDAMRRYGSPKPALNSGFFTIAGVTKPALFMHPPRSDFPVRIAVPRNGAPLRFSVGMLDGVWKAPICGDGVRFEARVRTPGHGERLVFSRYIDPKHDVTSRHWIPASLSLAAYAGRSIDLLLSTGPGPSGQTCNDWAVWGDFEVGGAQPTEGPFTAVYREPGIVLYRFANPLPRVSVYRHAIIAHDAEAARRALRRRDFDPRREVIVESDDPRVHLLGREPRAGVTSGTLVGFRSQQVEATLDAPATSIVMFNDAYFPGWNAYVDGRETPIFPADYLFRGIVVGAGRHEIAFRYQPRSFAIGATLSGVAAAALALLAVSAIVARTRRFVPRSRAVAA